MADPKPPPLSPDRTKTVLATALAIAVALASYFGIQSPCPECLECPAPAASAP
jgi:hypothetical protein